MTDLAGKFIDKPVKWGNERIIAALHMLPPRRANRHRFWIDIVMDCQYSDTKDNVQG